LSNSVTVFVITSTIVDLNGNAINGKLAFILIADVSTFKVPFTLKPETVNLNVPVVPFQDSVGSQMWSEY